MLHLIEYEIIFIFKGNVEANRGRKLITITNQQSRHPQIF